MAALCARLAAVSAGLTVGTHTVCAAAEDAKGPQLRPQQLSVYSPPASSTTFVEEQPGHVQKGFSAIRQTFHPFIEWYKGICNAAKNGVLNTVSFGQDSYSFIKNPPEGFLPRITVIAVSGFAGVVLARKGSRFKKVIYPLGLTTLGVSLCYPAQAVVVAKVTGQNVYAASHWTYGSIRSLWEKSGASKTTSTAPLATKSALDLKAPPEESPEKLNGPVLTTTSENALQKDESVQMRNNILQDHKQSAAIKTAAVTPSYFQSLSTDPSLASKSASSPDVGKKRFVATSKVMDHGQSKPEDADLYTTRS